MRRTASDPPPAGHPGLTPVLLSLGGFGAAFAVASCCALPLILSGLGIGSAVLGGLALLAAPHRAALLVAGAAGLGAGAFFLWRQRRTASFCAAVDLCSRPAVRLVTAAGLVLGTVLLVLGYMYV